MRRDDVAAVQHQRLGDVAVDEHVRRLVAEGRWVPAGADGDQEADVVGDRAQQLAVPDVLRDGRLEAGRVHVKVEVLVSAAEGARVEPQ